MQLMSFEFILQLKLLVKIYKALDICNFIISKYIYLSSV